jgi:BirA family biotin operon repressor/biotin-[acetyl-CoA-carboxylase] ligase
VSSRELDPSAFLTTARYGRSITLLAETRSTNDDARAALNEGAPDGHVIVADRQSVGRGAHGRVWESPGGTDLYFSICARIALPPAKIAPLTLAVGLGVARAIGDDAQIKWPNDVMLGGKKCCGILVETSTRGATLEGVIIGIGVDVNRDSFSAELGDIATSMKRARGTAFDRASVLARVIGAVEEEVDRFVAYGPPVDRVVQRLAWIGERVRCDDVEGTLIGLSPDGALRVESSSGVRTLVSGTLRRR